MSWSDPFSWLNKVRYIWDNDTWIWIIMINKLNKKVKNLLAIGTSHQVIIGTWTIIGIWLKDGVQMNLLMCPSSFLYS